MRKFLRELEATILIYWGIIKWTINYKKGR